MDSTSICLLMLSISQLALVLSSAIPNIISRIRSNRANKKRKQEFENQFSVNKDINN